MGYDAPTVRKIIAMRRKEERKRREEQEMLRLYCEAIQLELAL